MRSGFPATRSPFRQRVPKTTCPRKIVKTAPPSTLGDRRPSVPGRKTADGNVGRASFIADGFYWADRERPADVIVWANGFRPDLAHLQPLHLREPDGTIAVDGTRSVKEPALHLLGNGDWTGPGSATIIGVGRTARAGEEGLFA
jgi:hypothetical protein